MTGEWNSIDARKWKIKIGVLSLILFIVGLCLIIVAFSMRRVIVTVTDWGYVQDTMDNPLAGLFVGIGIGLLSGGLVAFLDELRVDDIVIGAIVGAIVGIIGGGFIGGWISAVIGAVGGAIVGGSLGEEFDGLVGASAAVGFVGFAAGWFIGGLFAGFIGGFAASVGGGLLGAAIEKWSLWVNKKTKRLEGEEESKYNMFAHKLQNLRATTAGLKATISYSERYGLIFNSERRTIDELERKMYETELTVEKIGSIKNRVDRLSELDMVLSRVTDIEKEVDIIDLEIKQRIEGAEKMYRWLVDFEALRDGQSITPEILADINKIYGSWLSLKEDKTVDERISAVKDELLELERIEKQYTGLSEHDTAAGKRAKKELNKIEAQLKAKKIELKQLENLKKEQEKNVMELEDEAKFYVLNALVGRVSVSASDVIDNAEKMIKTLREQLQKIEVPIGEFMGYQVIRREYRGGFADIYKIKRGKEYYALKVPKDADVIGEETLTLQIREEEIEDFKKEGKIWETITDIDGVVKLIEYGIRPFPWFIMEYMDEGTLRQKVREKGMGLKDAVEYSRNVLSILSEIHSRNVFHRDIKPENILFNSKGEIKLTDFGLSRVIGSSTSTGTGYKGTLAYSAPEQLDKEHYGVRDQRTDIYQLGAVLYEMLTGRPPFTGSTQEVIKGIMTNMPLPPSEINPYVPKKMDFVILKALNKRKEDRWQSALEFKRALEEVIR